MPPGRHLVTSVLALHVFAGVGAYKTAVAGIELIERATKTRWLSQCHHASAACCHAWRAKVERHFALLREQYRVAHLHKYTHLNVSDIYDLVQTFDVHEPTWNCESNDRVPNAFGDGPKQARLLGGRARTTVPVRPVLLTF